MSVSVQLEALGVLAVVMAMTLEVCLCVKLVRVHASSASNEKKVCTWYEDLIIHREIMQRFSLAEIQ